MTLPECVRFPKPRELPREAVERVRPAVVVASIEHAPAFTDDFLDRMEVLRVPVVAFGGGTISAEARDRADRLGLAPVLLPTGLAELDRQIAAAAE